MLDGKRYFASFPDEKHTAAQNERADTARPLTPALIAALAALDRELRNFLDATSDVAKN